MGILLQYNNATNYTYQELQTNTGLSPDAMNPALGILVKARVLTLAGGEKVGDENSRYELNVDFKR
jgi:cullin 1